jgi:DNA-binding transcriptional ArsR family regulator
MDELFSALSDPTRRQILLALSNTRLPAGEIAARFHQQRPAISKHLTLLKQAGVLMETRDRQKRLYAIAPHAFDPVLSLLARIRPPTKHVGLPASTAIKTWIRKEPPRSTGSARNQDSFNLDYD